MSEYGKEICVGDLVRIVRGHTEESLAKVERVTNKQFVAGNIKFWKESMREVGGNTWLSVHARIPTLSDIERIVMKSKRRKLSSVKWADVADEKIESIIEILGSD